MKLDIVRRFVTIDEKHMDAGRCSSSPLRKVAVGVVVKNPFCGQYVEDLAPLIDASVDLGRDLAELALSAFGPHEVQSYGKGGVVGIGGEQEHANALLTTVFADPFREAIGGGAAWISSMTKVSAPGSVIDIPLNHKDDVYVRSHYDGMSVMVPEGPLPDEIAVIFCIANQGRLNARVGGLTHEEVQARRTVPERV